MEKYLILILLLTLEIKSQGNNQNVIASQNENNPPFNFSVTECVVPPPDAIKNGKFEVKEDWLNTHLPDGKLHSYFITVTCNPGYEFVPLGSHPSIICIVNRTRDELPECLPACRRNTPEILSCGVGFDDKESKCILLGTSGVSRLPTASLKTTKDLQCGLTAKFPTTAVSKGVEAKREDAPWHAGVYTKTTKPYMQICGGTIVSTNVIMSAAHCYWSAIEKKLPPENFAVAVGKIYRPWDDPNDKNAQKSDVQEIRIPPRFHGAATNFQDDIALLILKEILIFTPYIVPACLDFDYDFDEMQLAHGKIGRVVGWGLTSEDGPASQILNKAELPVVNIEDCAANADPSFLESITSDKICAGYNNGTSVCRGDSGGGLAFQEYVDEHNRYYLRGIVSTAPTSDHLCNVYAVATFTHIIKHERFIKNAISQSPPPNSVPTYEKRPPILTIFNNSSEPGLDKNPLNSNKPLIYVRPDERPLIVETSSSHEKPGTYVEPGFNEKPGIPDTLISNKPLTYVNPGSDEKPNVPLTFTRPMFPPIPWKSPVTTIETDFNKRPETPEENVSNPGIPDTLISNKPLTYVNPGSDEKPNVPLTFTRPMFPPIPWKSPVTTIETDFNKRPETPEENVSNPGIPDTLISNKPLTYVNPGSDEKPNVPLTFTRPMFPPIPWKSPVTTIETDFNKRPETPEENVSNQPLTYSGPTSNENFGHYENRWSDVSTPSHWRPDINQRNENQQKPINQEHGSHNMSYFYRDEYHTPTNHEKPLSNVKDDFKNVNNDKPVSDNTPIIYNDPVNYHKAVIYENSVTYEGPVTYLSSVSHRGGLNFMRPGAVERSMSYDRLGYNDKPVTVDRYGYHDRPVFNDRTIYRENAVYYDRSVYNDKSVMTDDKAGSHEKIDFVDSPIIYDSPVIYKLSVLYENSVTYKDFKVYYNKNENQFRKDVVASATELNNQGVKIEIGIDKNEKHTNKHKNREETNSSVNKSENEAKNTSHPSNQSNSNKHMQNKKPVNTNMQSSFDDDDDDDKNQFQFKPHLFDKDHPVNRAINLQKPDKKQQSHWHPLTPETWPFFKQNFESGNLNPGNNNQSPSSGNSKNSSYNDFVPEGYRLFRQKGLSHQSTNILINTHNGPVTIGDISSVVNFYYKSANRTVPNVEE